MMKLHPTEKGFALTISEDSWDEIGPMDRPWARLALWDLFYICGLPMHLEALAVETEESDELPEDEWPQVPLDAEKKDFHAMLCREADAFVLKTALIRGRHYVIYALPHSGDAG